MPYPQEHSFMFGQCNLGLSVILDVVLIFQYTGQIFIQTYIDRLMSDLNSIGT